MSEQPKPLTDAEIGQRIKALVELERGLEPYKEKVLGSIRIDLNEVRAIVGVGAALGQLRRERDEAIAALAAATSAV